MAADLTTQEGTSKPESTSQRSRVLESKLMTVKDKDYTLDVRQIGENRFCRIMELTHSNRRSRIVVPMSVVGAYIKCLQEVADFANGYTIKNLSKPTPGQKIEYAFSTSYVSDGGRRYYFDLLDSQDVLTLRLSYIFFDRDSCTVLTETIPSIILVLENFQRNYPSLSPEDDYPPPEDRRRNFKRSGGRSPRGRRGGSRFRRSFGAPRQSFYGGNGSKPTDAKRVSTLQVLPDPAPAYLTHNAKKYTFEVVEGTNTFLRITEIINDSRKSTLHVPIEICQKVQNMLADFSKKMSTISKPSSNGVPNTQK